ncbi:C2H2 transcription factor Swi5 [Cordyceps fumosorosea ARSEF 2679]|uniref:pH-response transcription factor pacC/RIM101 n=1 Tax=Cordyceps fumosorosea (strain ARSEF 2679) TaxID=1081104 RepID=A0A167NX84_CORFA|nr:C2H2 transcription factor Swi5 [Cordyceps fumosorosea ARSEF 2679]OAA56049.1 C2H2 transcription factor Swi5 [Cordyceps fumosorosea ARSEF 2679]
MLSNPTTTRPPRQRQHRRQNSTPSAFEGGTAQNMPSGINRRQAVAHRRGLSLDIRRFQMTPPTSERQDNMHRVLREAQQQRTQARPGPHPNHNHNPYLAMRHGNTENFTMSPDHTPHSQRFSASSPFNPSSAPFDPYGEQLNLMMQRNQGSYGDNLSSARNFELFTVENAQSMSSYTGIPESPSQGWMADGGNATLRRSTRRISDGIMDRVAIFENMNGEEAQAPSTPPNYNENDTPHDRAGKQEARAARFAEDYDDSMEETLKPTRTRGQPRAQDVFQEMRQQAQMASAVPSPPQSTPLPNSKTFNAVPMQTTDFLSMNSFKDEFMEGFDTTLSRDNFLPEEPSQHTTPETHHMGGFASGCDSRSEYPNYQEAEAAHLQQRSMHRRTESVASIASAASIASINIEETKTETGVTTEEIAQFIQSPDASDGKWVCLFEECGKEFGRKENIKSHVQTHLNDRQYQCPTCKKCFVRQHDLKRHAKIHTGIKPYPCDCGNSFARHDALTRHRQRGMCIGAFDGIVRKTVKRGRPKKHRPDMETRMEKSARTRRKNNMSVSSMSSFSGYSDSSVANSPEPDFCMTDELMDMGPVDSSMHGMAALSSAPMPMMVSRRNVAAVVASPSVASVHSYVSPEAIMDKEPELPVNSAAGQWSSAPPSLTRSSSPPAVEVIPMSRNASSNMDSDELVDNIEHGEMAASAAANNTLPMNLSQQEEDLMLQFTHDDDLVPLERDLMGKFEEEFNMFTNHDDPFFGNS